MNENTNNFDPTAAMVAPTTRVAVVVAGREFARPDAWVAAFDALPGVDVHLCADLAVHGADDAPDLVVFTGAGNETAPKIWAALGDSHVVYDQVFATSAEEIRELYAFAEEQGRHLGHVLPMGRPVEHVVEQLSPYGVGAVRRASVRVVMAGPAEAAASGPAPDRIALDALGLALTLFDGRPLVWIEDDPAAPVRARFAPKLGYADGAELTVAVAAGAGDEHAQQRLEVEFADGTVATLNLVADSDALIIAHLFRTVAHEQLTLRMSHFAAECFQETALAVLAKLRSDNPVDDGAAAVAVARLRVAAALSLIAAPCRIRLNP